MERSLLSLSMIRQELPTTIFMPILLDEAECGRDSGQNMWIIFAHSTHRLMTEEELAGGVGTDVGRSCRQK